jgi:hypothetical protein
MSYIYFWLSGLSLFIYQYILLCIHGQWLSPSLYCQHTRYSATIYQYPFLLFPNPWPGEIYDDLHSFDPAYFTWSSLSAALDGALAPDARDSHGFTSAGDKLYVYGGLVGGGKGVGYGISKEFLC